MENRELSKREWLDKCEAYCAKSEHCAADVRRKLYEWSAPVDLFDEIVENLYTNDFLNDARYCHAYVHDKVAYQSWGRLKIQAGLRALDLPEPEIRKSLDEIDQNQYFTNLKALIKQRKSDSPDKLLRFLAQRGFTYDEISSVPRA
jgi:regulatory protein